MPRDKTVSPDSHCSQRLRYSQILVEIYEFYIPHHYLTTPASVTV